MLAGMIEGFLARRETYMLPKSELILSVVIQTGMVWNGTLLVFIVWVSVPATLLLIKLQPLSQHMTVS